MTRPMTVERELRFHRCRKGRREAVAGAASEPVKRPAGRVPRVARLMALAIRFDQLIRDGAVADYATLARLGRVTRARITQIANLRLLAPDIQEAILFLPRVEQGRDPIHLRQLQPIALLPDWKEQRRMWRRLQSSAGVANSAHPDSYGDS